MTATLRGETIGRTAFSGQEFRQALGCFATGVTVITTSSGEHGYGMTANAFSSVSLDPPLVLVCAITGNEGSEIIARNGKFAVNILAADQEPLSRYFASKDRPRGPDAFRALATERVGALGDRFLGRRRPLGQARLLWEIGADGVDLRSLRSRLGLDSGYVSRLLRALEQEGLVTVAAGTADRRVRRAVLTSRGR